MAGHDGEAQKSGAQAGLVQREKRVVEVIEDPKIRDVLLAGAAGDPEPSGLTGEGPCSSLWKAKLVTKNDVERLRPVDNFLTQRFMNVDFVTLCQTRKLWQQAAGQPRVSQPLADHYLHLRSCAGGPSGERPKALRALLIALRVRGIFDTGTCVGKDSIFTCSSRVRAGGNSTLPPSSVQTARAISFDLRIRSSPGSCRHSAVSWPRIATVRTRACSTRRTAPRCLRRTGSSFSGSPTAPRHQ